ncbi:hypothetical protein ElyMa_005882200 [Elysia marginata]|uniref:Uncharacterized protein n=1 Tax=Elysia marginata TaxID=1093978 RepID=A0AAV4G285_9GAST|nr:hypothetical protein ElyMa_005882200 [Elysia marginata]
MILEPELSFTAFLPSSTEKGTNAYKTSPPSRPDDQGKKTIDKMNKLRVCQATMIYQIQYCTRPSDILTSYAELSPQHQKPHGRVSRQPCRYQHNTITTSLTGVVKWVGRKQAGKCLRVRECRGKANLVHGRQVKGETLASVPLGVTAPEPLCSPSHLNVAQHPPIGGSYIIQCGNHRQSHLAVDTRKFLVH